MVSVEEFMKFHGACPEGRRWAIKECPTMDDVWQKAKGEWLIWVATRSGVATPKEQRLLAVHAARSVSHLLTSPDSLRAIEVAERHAHGLATDDELADAWADAAAVASAAAWAAADAARDAADAARATAWAALAAAWAASDAARATAWAASATAWAARVAAWAARVAASDAAWEDFAQWARSNIKPDFTRLVSRDE